MAMFRLLPIALLLLLASSGCHGSDQLEGFDEPIETSKPSKRERIVLPADVDGVFMDIGDAVPAASGGASKAKPARQSASAAAAGPKKSAGGPLTVLGNMSKPNLYVEITAGSLLLLYVIILFLGKRSNNNLAEAWARTFAMSGSIMDKNFSYTGPKDTGAVLMRESGNVYKFYASGRRHCAGLLAELQLLARQDALSMLWNLVSPSEDQVQIEVFMHDTSMPPIVLAIATPKHARAMQRDVQDINHYTKRVQVSKDAFPAGDKLWILTEHSSIFTDLFSDPKVLQMFNYSGAAAPALKYFRSLHFTSENSEGTHKQVLRFVFKLPPAHQMEALTGLMEMVPLFIDLVGSYKLPGDLKKKAVEARTKQAEADEELRRKRQEALMQKKMEKAQEERAKLARMAPEARQKAEEKLQRQQYKKAMKSRVVRI